MKKYIHHRLGLVNLLAFFCLLSAMSTAAPGLREQLSAQKAHFLSSCEKSFETNSENAAWLKAFLNDADKTRARPAKDWTRALRNLVRVGKQEDVFFKNTGFVKDRMVVELLVAALNEPEAETRDVALKTLAEATRQSDLEHFSDSIKAALATLPPDAGILVMAKLPLTPSERLQVRERPGVPLEAKARLGDAIAEQELIRQFTQETNYFTKRGLAQRLGYAGTSQCAQALVEALRSPVSLIGFYGDRSIRADILLALGQIYQDEPLFTCDACLLADNDDQTFNRVRGIDKYCKEVNEWVQQHFGHPAWGSEELWFIRWHNVPEVRPVTNKQER